MTRRRTTTTVERHIGNWLDQYPKRTREGYRLDLHQFRTWLGRDPITATRPEVQAWLRHLEGLGRAPTTIRRKASSVSSFLRYCAEENLIAYNPAAHTRRPKGAGDAKLGLTTEQARALLAVAKQHDRQGYALIALVLTTGIRVSEAVCINLGDVALDAGHHYLTFTRKGGKEARLKLDPRTVAILDELAAGRTDGPYFRNPNTRRRWSRQHAHATVQELGAKTGITGLHPHLLRHTAATAAIRAGATAEEVQAMLGHADITTTQRYIARIRAETTTPTDKLGDTFL